MFLALGHFDRLLRKTIDVLDGRAIAMQAALADHMPTFDTRLWRRGSSVWVRGPDGLDSRTLAVAAQRLAC